MMKKLRHILFTLPAAILMASAIAVPVHADGCNVSVFGSTSDANTPTSRFQVTNNGTVGSTTFNVTGTCTLTLASWEAPNGTFDTQNILTQKLHDHTTETLTTGTHTMSVSMANCFFQIDLVLGSSPFGPDGDANYKTMPPLIAFAQGGTQACVQPKFSCNQLDFTLDNDKRTVTISKLDTTAENGATFANAVINWGDTSMSEPLTDGNIIRQQHTYANDGSFQVTAATHFTVNGQPQTAPSTNCTKTASFTTPTPPVTPQPPATPATPVQPTALVNTGPGAVLGLSAVTAIVGALGYNLFVRRLARR